MEGVKEWKPDRKRREKGRKEGRCIDIPLPRWPMLWMIGRKVQSGEEGVRGRGKEGRRKKIESRKE